MLEFARELYLRSPPNQSAWSAAWEAFLRGQGFLLGGEDIIRRKFTEAFRYFGLLQVHTGVHVRKCELMLRVTESLGIEEQGDGDGDDEDWVDEDALVDADYLPNACQLCFGAFAAHDGRAP